MRKAKSEQVQQLLEEFSLIEPGKYKMLLILRDMILSTYPETEERVMYGGIVFFMRGVMYSGLFVRKNFITLEFSEGFQMIDPNGFLEGKGKFRRHLKIFKQEDIEGKAVGELIEQAFRGDSKG
jgi:hypothetical protein